MEAMIENLRRRVCDLCGRADGVQQYRINYLAASRQLTVDLCDKDAKPLESIREKVPRGRSRSAPPRVVTQDAVRKARRSRKAIT
jgi:hypothetical protein